MFDDAKYKLIDHIKIREKKRTEEEEINKNSRLQVFGDDEHNAYESTESTAIKSQHKCKR